VHTWHILEKAVFWCTRMCLWFLMYVTIDVVPYHLCNLLLFFLFITELQCNLVNVHHVLITVLFLFHWTDVLYCMLVCWHILLDTMHMATYIEPPITWLCPCTPSIHQPCLSSCPHHFCLSWLWTIEGDLETQNISFSSVWHITQRHSCWHCVEETAILWEEWVTQWWW